MKKGIIKLTWTLIAVSIFSCNTEVEKTKASNSTIKKYVWLLGNWEQIQDKTKMMEHWVQQNDSTFIGHSYIIQGADTVFAEQVTFEERNNKLSYIPITLGQNDGKPVSFDAKELKENSIVFENLKHDYPQQISYHLINKDSLYAEISGPMKGEIKKQGFPYYRIKN